jgi:hypothetical protein
MLKLHFTLDWELLVAHPDEEISHVDIYVSTEFSKAFFTQELSEDSGSTRLSLSFPLVEGKTLTIESLLLGCNLNMDFFTKVYNTYHERVQNPAGSVVIPLHEIVCEGEMAAGIDLYMVRRPEIRSKGQVHVGPLKVAGLSKPAPIVMFKDTPIVKAVHLNDELVKEAVQETAASRMDSLGYTEATEYMYELLKPTIEQVKNFQSAVYVTRAGIVSALLYTVDVVEPKASIEFFANMCEIVRRRMRLKTSELLAIDTNTLSSPEGAKRFSQFAGWVLELYTNHCTYANPSPPPFVSHPTRYRLDFVWAFNQKKGKFENVATDCFGDVSVDKGASVRACFCFMYLHFFMLIVHEDCEDFTRIMNRIYLMLRRMRLRGELSGHPLLLKLAEFLASYVPTFALLGSSAKEMNEKNAANIKKLGAHENCFLVPLNQFIEAIDRADAEATADWLAEFEKAEPLYRVARERSKKLQLLILEGTPTDLSESF